MMKPDKLCEMRPTSLALFLVLVYSPAVSQVPPVSRYNQVAETIFLLERCRALTAERRAWLENVRGHAVRATGWNAVQQAEQDGHLRRELKERYPTLAPERCAELARNVDNEQATTVKAPLN